jgi:hypothetical protein
VAKMSGKYEGPKGSFNDALSAMLGAKQTEVKKSLCLNCGNNPQRENGSYACDLGNKQGLKAGPEIFECVSYLFPKEEKGKKKT